MNAEERAEIRNLLDWERQTVAYPGVVRLSEHGLIKEVSPEGKSCEIVYSSCSEEEINFLIQQQVQTAQEARYIVEWKVYGHDLPLSLGDRLESAGFRPGAKEAFMVLRVSSEALDCFRGSDCDIRRITTREGLADYQRVVEEVRGREWGEEIERYALMLEKYPNNMSIYVAYVEGEPAASGRIYFHENSRFAALYGGNTRERFRKRGLFTQMVAARIGEALSRGVDYVCVDALPTSEPILSKRRFETITDTQPFTFSLTFSAADP